MKEQTVVEIVIYTDPLCCWSFVMDEQIHEFRQRLGDNIPTRYCMGGLLPSWKQFHDPVQMVSKPIQMGPVWHEASIMSGVKLNDKIWFTDPPSSSYTACMAVKAAGFQSPEAETMMLKTLQKAVMTEGINISKLSTILKVAANLESDCNGFSLEVFEKDMHDEKTMHAFRKDLEEIAVKGISRFPTILLRFDNGRSSMISGYRKLDELLSCTVVS